MLYPDFTLPKQIKEGLTEELWVKEELKRMKKNITPYKGVIVGRCLVGLILVQYMNIILNTQIDIKLSLSL